MQRSLLTFLLIFFFKIALCQTVADFNTGTFRPFQAWKDKPRYFAAIVPDSSYLYLKFVYNPGLDLPVRKHQTVFERGDKKYAKLTKRRTSVTGFLKECAPGFCMYYIVAVKQDGSVVLVDTSEKLKTFIGKIDNLDEVELLVRDHQYRIRPEYIESGSYQERENDYLLYIADFYTDLYSDPGIIFSTKAVLTKQGEFKIIESTKIFGKEK